MAPPTVRTSERERPQAPPYAGEGPGTHHRTVSSMSLACQPLERSLCARLVHLLAKRE